MADIATHPSAADYTHKVRYVAIFALLLTLLIAGIMVRGILSSIDNTPSFTPAQSSNGTTNQGTTSQTGAPARDTGTPADRTIPSPSGGGGNTLLKP